MAEPREISTADLKAATGAPASRLSEIVTTLGIRARASRGGTTVGQFSLQDAVRIVLVRRLQALGLPLGEAAKAVRAITEQHLAEIIVAEAQRWLVVTAIGAEVADGERVLAIAEGREGGLQGLRLVRVDTAVRDVLAAKLERHRTMIEANPQPEVTAITVPGGITGAFLGRDLSLNITLDGAGLSLRLDPDQARELARELYTLAEGKAPEVKN